VEDVIVIIQGMDIAVNLVHEFFEEVGNESEA
jgi:hypothetical protein